MADLRISQLSALSEAALQSSDDLAIVDGSASETKKISAKDLVQGAVALIDNDSIPGSKIDGNLAPGSIDTAELADGSVTAAKLADSSTATLGTSAPSSGDYIGQLFIDTPTHTTFVWDGSTWKALDIGVTSVAGGSSGDVTTTVTTVGGTNGVIASIDNSAVAAEFMAGPTASAGSVRLRTIVPADLPVATGTTAGVVTVPSGSGLTVGDGTPGSSDLSIDNDIASSSTHQLCTYTAKGLVNGGRAIEAGDLPLATSGTVGAIKAGSEFSVDGFGELKLANQITGGTHTKVSYNNQGNITSGTNLQPSDIPALDADKITTGTLSTARIADKAVTKEKLANFATAYIQEAQPAILAADPTGIVWYQESTAQLRINNGNSWMPVGFGRLSQENLRFGGTVDANTGNVANLTDAGRTAGLTVGDAVPAATDALGGLYLVVSVAGNNIGVVSGVGFDAGDWCLCINATDGWIRIDVTSGGGGGGGATVLNDLLDVDINTPQTGDTLLYNATSGQWENKTTTADRVTLSPAFDGTRTQFNLSTTIADQNNVLLSVGGVILEPGVDFTIGSGKSVIDFASAPPLDSTYFILNQQSLNSGGGGGGTTLPPGSSENEYLQWDNALSSWKPSTILSGGSY